MRGLILRQLDAYQRDSPLREPTQGASYHFLEHGRRVLLGIARRAATGDLLFVFSIAELEAYFRHGRNPELLARVRERRDQWRVAQTLYLPHVVRSGDLGAVGRVPVIAEGARELTGQGVSRGTARGRARVVHGLDEAREIQAGEILAAAEADPSWTPLFLIAGGVVLETDGMLCHPAIVAREFGLPALVNVPHATRILRTGQVITLDADGGRAVIEG